MSPQDYIPFLNSEQPKDFRGLDILTTLFFKQAKLLAGAKDGYIFIFKSDSLIRETKVYNKNGQDIQITSRLKLELDHQQNIQEDKELWFHKNDPLIEEIETGVQHALYFHFYSQNKFQNGFLLTDPESNLEKQKKEILIDMGKYVSLCIENMFINLLMKKRISYLLNFDDLVTKLPNRRVFNECIIETISQITIGHFFAILFIDIDNLKYINRKLGHRIGDKLLFIMAERMSRINESLNIRSMLARIGGDEFAFLCHNPADKKQIEDLAKEILLSIKEPVSLNNIDYIITASIGIGIFPDNAQNPEDLIYYAEQAMYKAKDKGKDKYYFYN